MLQIQMTTPCLSKSATHTFKVPVIVWQLPLSLKIQSSRNWLSKSIFFFILCVNHSCKIVGNSHQDTKFWPFIFWKNSGPANINFRFYIFLYLWLFALWNANFFCHSLFFFLARRRNYLYLIQRQLSEMKVCFDLLI